MSKRRKTTASEKKAKSTKKAAANKKAPAATPAPVPLKGKGTFDDIIKIANGKKIVLHIGCGAYNPQKLHQSYHGDDWFELRFDIDPNVKPHIVADMRDLSMIPDGSVDAVWSSHNVEHLYPHDVEPTIKEFFRVIKNEGHFLVTLPDMQTVANYVAHGKLMEPIYDSPAGPISPIDIMYGLRSSMAQGNLFMAHKTAFTAQSLVDVMQGAGFSNLRVQRKWVDLWAIGYKFDANDSRRKPSVDYQSDMRGHEMVMPEPMPINRSRHPGQFSSGKLTDELNIPPKKWEPLNLKKA